MGSGIREDFLIVIGQNKTIKDSYWSKVVSLFIPVFDASGSRIIYKLPFLCENINSKRVNRL